SANSPIGAAPTATHALSKTTPATRMLKVHRPLSIPTGPPIMRPLSCCNAPVRSRLPRGRPHRDSPARLEVTPHRQVSFGYLGSARLRTSPPPQALSANARVDAPLRQRRRAQFRHHPPPTPPRRRSPPAHCPHHRHRYRLATRPNTLPPRHRP